MRIVRGTEMMLFCCEYILDIAWICKNNAKRMKRMVLKQLNSERNLAKELVTFIK